MSSKKSHRWTTGEYFILKPAGREAVSSPVSPNGIWGIRKDEGGFVVTHIPSGCKFSMLRKPWPTEKLAKEFVGKIQPLANWKRAKPSQPDTYPKNTRAKVDAVINKLLKSKATK